MNLSKNVKATRVSNAVAAGQTAINSSSVDMQGFDGCEFIVAMGSITSGAVTSCKAQGSPDNTAWSDLAGTSQTIGDTADNKLFLIDVPFPRHRYLRCVVSRATQDSVVDGVVALQYLPKVEPVTHDSTVGGSELHHAPATGTA
jgi:hypothetical protein